jgi:hypothetical protein
MLFISKSMFDATSNVLEVVFFFQLMGALLEIITILFVVLISGDIVNEDQFTKQGSNKNNETDDFNC